MLGLKEPHEVLNSPTEFKPTKNRVSHMLWKLIDEGMCLFWFSMISFAHRLITYFVYTWICLWNPNNLFLRMKIDRWKCGFQNILIHSVLCGEMTWKNQSLYQLYYISLDCIFWLFSITKPLPLNIICYNIQNICILKLRSLSLDKTTRVCRYVPIQRHILCYQLSSQTSANLHQHTI